MKPKILLSVGAKSDSYKMVVEGCGAVADVRYCPPLCTDYDGLILCGGSDINPAIYGEEINGSVDIDYERDNAEIAVVKEFIRLKKPILGICRGHQLLNVLFGGTLHQHISNHCFHRGGNGEDAIHSVTAVGKSIFSEIYGNCFSTNSMHHQAVNKIGNNFNVVLTANDEFSTVEAMVHNTLPILSVQWHPERMCFDYSRSDTVDGRYVFEHFIKMCF